MAIKSSIISTINGFITAIITQAKVRSAFSTVVDNFYPTPVYDTQATTNVFTKADNDFNYTARIAKTGRTVNVSGSFTNVSGSTVGSQTLCTITDAEYNNYVFATDQTFTARSTAGNIVIVSVSGNSLYLIGTMPNNMQFYFDISYLTAN